MMQLAPTITDSWNANNAVNNALLEHLTRAMLEARTPGERWTVGQHIAHMVGFYKWFSVRFDERLKSLPDLQDREAEENVFVGDLEQIRSVWPQTRDAVLNAVQHAKDKGKMPHSSLEHFVIHVLVHDAHHRGQILLALKVAGFGMEDDENIWKPWRTETHA